MHFPCRYRLTVSTSAALLAMGAAHAGALRTLYTDPAQLTRVPFGSHSHWAQPWRAYLETMPATTFLNGTGVNWNVGGQGANLVAQMLAGHGIHHVRIEIGWGNLRYNDETQLADPVGLGQTLLACKKFGLRPLILLNSHQGVPCPVQMFSRKVTAAVHRGDQTVQLESTDGLRVGYSGLSNLTGYCAAEGLITRIDGNTVTLSKPLPKDIAAGTAVPMATLKYRPFSVPGTADYQETIEGWQRYVQTVARAVSYGLGTTNSADKGFDMEIWNELTFGSQFLSINNYYAKSPVKYNQNIIRGNLVSATTTYVEAHPADFAGVQFGDGFANTIPWPSSSGEPARVVAIDKHPYHGRSNFPKDAGGGTNLNALYQPDPYVPTYSAFFPEYFGTLLQTETLLRDASPLTDSSFAHAGLRGRFARTIDNRTSPVSVWITEVNIGPAEDQPAISAARALAVKAKAITRYFCFFLNKGVTQLDLFAISGGDKDLGVVQDNFLDYAKQPGAVYPGDDTHLTSPALAAVGRIAARMSQDLDPALTETRALTVTALSDTHDHYQFQGDGTPAHPTLYDRDVFAFLPYQANAHRFVIPYYVMTRDVMVDMPTEAFTIHVKGLHGTRASVKAYDPIRDAAVPVTVVSRAPDDLTLKVQAGDSPRLLTIQENTTVTAFSKKSVKKNAVRSAHRKRQH